MTNCKKCIRIFYRRLFLTIPHKIPAYFDENLGTWNMQLQKVQTFRDIKYNKVYSMLQSTTPVLLYTTKY